MIDNKPEGRDAVEKFFTFYFNNQDLVKDSPSWGWVVGIAILSYFISSSAGFNPAVSAAIGGGAVYLIDSWLKQRKLNESELERQNNEQELARLARETRSTQSQDIVKAFLRVFERTLLNKDDLRMLDQKYVLDAERDLFGEESMEVKLGHLVNKSIRLISRGESTDSKFRKVYWRDRSETETFFNPLRLVCLFLAERQLVICDVTIDSETGSLKEEINRYSLSQIVSISLQAERKRLNLSKEQIAKTARDLGYDEKRISELEASLDKDSRLKDKKWSREESTSLLKISRTDGGVLQVPVRSELLFGDHDMALDQDETLTQEEITIDRMVNELNQLVNPVETIT